MENMLDWETGNRLFKQYYKGDKGLIFELAIGYMPIIYPIINKLKEEYNLSFAFIYQNALEELLNAIESYSLEKQAQFPVYAKTYIESTLESKFRLCCYNDKINKKDNVKIKK